MSNSVSVTLVRHVAPSGPGKHALALTLDMTDESSRILASLGRALESSRPIVIYTAPDVSCVQTAETLLQVGISVLMQLNHKSSSKLIATDLLSERQLDELSFEHARWLHTLEFRAQADNLDTRATAVVEMHVLPWLDTPGMSHTVLVADETILHRILQTIMALNGQPPSVLRDPTRRVLPVHTAPLQPGAYHQLLVGISHGPDPVCDVRVVSMNETAHLPSQPPAYPNSPLFAAPSELAQLMRTPESSAPSSPVVPQPPISLHTLTRSTHTPPSRNTETPRPETASRSHLSFQSNPSPSPSRGRSGVSLVSLPLGSRSSSSTPQPPRNLHLYDMSTMMRSIDKWESARIESNDLPDPNLSPRTTSRTLDHGTTSKSSSPFPGGGMLGFSNFLSGGDSSGSAASTPTLTHRGSVSSGASTSVLSTHTQSSAPLSNVSAFAQSLFGHHTPAGASGSTTGDAMSIWQGICVRIFPLFNHEVLSTPVENIADSTETYVRLVFERDAAQAPSVLEDNLRKSVLIGLLSVTTKLQGHEDMSLLKGLVKSWQFYYGTVIPYTTACLLPLSTSAAQLTFRYQAAQQRRPPHLSEDGEENSQRTKVLLPAQQGVDIRRVMLIAFRDRVVLPIHDWLLNALGRKPAPDPSFLHQHGSEGEAVSKELRPYLIQLVGTLTGLHTDDAAQERMEKLNKSLAYIPSVPISIAGSLSPQFPISPHDSLSPGFALSAHSSASSIPSEP